MLGGFRSPGTQRGREGGIHDGWGAKPRTWSERRGEFKKWLSEKIVRNKCRKGRRIFFQRWRKCEIHRDGKNLKRSLASRLLPS